MGKKMDEKVPRMPTCQIFCQIPEVSDSCQIPEVSDSGSVRFR